jgi:hypothetical protein
MTLREDVCLARHGYHLVEWYQSNYRAGTVPYHNQWKCRWCGHLDLSSMGRWERTWYCRMNLGIGVELWEDGVCLKRFYEEGQP